MNTTVSFEVLAEPEAGYSYGGLVDKAIAGGAVYAAVDLRTPSSASAPTLTYVVLDEAAEDAVARAFNYPNAAELYADREPSVRRGLAGR